MTAADPLASDTGLLAPGRVGSPASAATSDAAYLRALLDAEAALTRAQASLGLAPAEAATAVTRAAGTADFDLTSIALRARGGGNPVIPLVTDLTAAVATEFGPYVHRGATSQDILDSAGDDGRGGSAASPGSGGPNGQGGPGGGQEGGPGGAPGGSGGSDGQGGPGDPNGSGGSGGQTPAPGGSGRPGTDPGFATDVYNGISIPVPDGWTGQSGAGTAAVSTKDTYKCPGDTSKDCQRGGAYSAPATAQKLKSRTAEAAAKEDISKNATESYGKGYGSITSHTELSSKAVTVAGEKGYLVRWKVVTSKGDDGYVESLVFPSPADHGSLVVVRFGVDIGSKAPEQSIIDTITKGIKVASGTGGNGQNV
ncbi:hypothetical protein [Streptomyces sp. NPDC059371]|uniref:hypothetical protein n=1 Tax=Streptomyces sp. NPDC059371 TaxID=3346812 RepID=UPI00367780F4